MWCFVIINVFSKLNKLALYYSIASNPLNCIAAPRHSLTCLGPSDELSIR